MARNGRPLALVGLLVASCCCVKAQLVSDVSTFSELIVWINWGEQAIISINALDIQFAHSLDVHHGAAVPSSLRSARLSLAAA
jgi:hypothetical protein